jgi:hypothetical protein
MKNKIIFAMILSLSGCAALGRWNGAREYRKSQVQGKTVWGGYGYGYMQGWYFAESEEKIKKLLERLKIESAK